MNEIDRTPLPAVVDVPQAPDSGSGRPVVFEAGTRSAYSVRGARRKLGRALVFGSALTLATLGPDAKDAYMDNQRDEANAAVAEVEKIQQPVALQGAQSQAAARLFGAKGTETAQKIVDTPGKWDVLKASNYLPDHVEVSEDEKTFITEEQRFGISRIVGANGGVYIVTNKSVEREGLLGDMKTHPASPLLVGGAHNDLTSDRDGDGVVTREEVFETADESARTNLRRAFAPKEQKIIGADGKPVKLSQR